MMNRLSLVALVAALLGFASAPLQAQTPPIFSPNTVLTAANLNAGFAAVCPIGGCTYAGPVKFTTGGALVVPVWVSTARPVSPSVGQLGFASDLGAPELYTGSVGGWVDLGTVVSITADAPLTGGAITRSGHIGLGTVPVTLGGTGLTGSYIDGQLLIGDSSTGGLDAATLAAGNNIVLTVGHGTITVAEVASGPSLLNGVAYPSSPGTLTVPVVTGSNVVNYEIVPLGAGGTGSATAAGARSNLGLGTAAQQAASSATGTVAAVTGTIIPGDAPVFTDSSGTVGDSGTVPGGTGSSGGAPQGRLTLQSGSPLITTQEAIAATRGAGTITASYSPGDCSTLTGGTETVNAALCATSTAVTSLTVSNPGTTAAGLSGSSTSALPGHGIGDVLILSGGTFTGSLTGTVTSVEAIAVATGGAAGTSCTNGTYTVGLSTGTGTQMTASATISSNAVTSITLLTGGNYTVEPTAPTSLSGALLTGVAGCSQQPTIKIAFGVLTASIATNTAAFTANASTLTSTDTTKTQPSVPAGATFTALYGPNALAVSTPGVYSAVPSNPVSQGSTSGTGAGANFTLTWATGMTGATTIYYQSFGGGQNVPVWLGTSFGAESIGSGLSLALDSNSGHTGYQASGNIYDIFAAMNGSTLVIGTGPAWSSTTARGTGAGTTQLAQESGIWVNANAITLRYGNSSGNTLSVPADEATYLGSMYATANGQTSLNLGCYLEPGGANNVAGLYNAYHQMRTPFCEGDSTSSWSYTTATWRAADNSTSNRITFLDGLGAAPIGGSYSALVEADSTGIDIDSSTVTPMLIATAPASLKSQIVGDYIGPPMLGLHYLQAMELGTTSGLITGNGQQWLRANLDN